MKTSNEINRVLARSENATSITLSPFHEGSSPNHFTVIESIGDNLATERILRFITP